MGLFSNKHSEGAVELVASRFEAEGAGFIYYHGAGHGGIPVTVEEREILLVRYRRDLQRMMWGGVAVVVVAIAGVTFWNSGKLDDNPLIFWGSVGLMCLIFGLGSVYIGKGPLRYLERRPATRPAKSKQEIQSEFLRSSSWGTLVGMPLLIALPVGDRAVNAKSTLETALWGGATLLILGLTARNAYRKWHIGSTDRS